jgi:hypothetical protein
MSVKNMDKSRSVTLLIWIIILNFGIAFLVLHNSSINLVNILPFALGITELLICLFFFLFEKVGD